MCLCVLHKISTLFRGLESDSGKVVVPLSKINPKHANNSIVGKQGVEPKGISFHSDFMVFMQVIKGGFESRFQSKVIK